MNWNHSQWSQVLISASWWKHWFLEAGTKCRGEDKGSFFEGPFRFSPTSNLSSQVLFHIFLVSSTDVNSFSVCKPAQQIFEHFNVSLCSYIAFILIKKARGLSWCDAWLLIHLLISHCAHLNRELWYTHLMIISSVGFSHRKNSSGRSGTARIYFLKGSKVNRNGFCWLWVGRKFAGPGLVWP